MCKIDVLLSMYNGERYLKEQLDSIIGQTVLPDNIYVIDDCSTDESAKIVEQYIEQNSVKNIEWNLIKNNKNVGWKVNFYKGLLLCKGDYIFLCDQDDIWEKNKIAEMLEVMEKNKGINYLVCNYSAFSDDKEDSFVKKSKRYLDDGTLQFVFPNERFTYIGRPGCCGCIRKTFFDELMLCWDQSVAHDAQLWRYSCVSNSLAILNRKLVRYRRHSSNVTKVVKTTYEMRISDMEYFLDVFSKLLRYEKISKEGEKIVKKEIVFIKSRLELLLNFSFFKAISLLAFYKYYANIGGYIKDIYLAFRKKYLR